MIVVQGDDRIVRQVDKQVSKLVDIEQVDVLDPKSAVVREHLLIKVERTMQNSEKLVEMANVFHANILSVEANTMILELTGDATTINSLHRNSIIRTACAEDTCALAQWRCQNDRIIPPVGVPHRVHTPASGKPTNDRAGGKTGPQF